VAAEAQPRGIGDSRSELIGIRLQSGFGPFESLAVSESIAPFPARLVVRRQFHSCGASAAHPHAGYRFAPHPVEMQITQAQEVFMTKLTIGVLAIAGALMGAPAFAQSQGSNQAGDYALSWGAVNGGYGSNHAYARVDRYPHHRHWR
jgi:hypothetical protein